MTPGVVTGGWEFVWAVYAVSFAVYTVYTVLVIGRWRRDRDRAVPTPQRR